MFIQRANNTYNEPWRWILGFIAIFLGCQFFGAIPFLIAMVVEEISVNGNVNNMMGADESYLMNVLSHNTTFFYLMLTFVIGTIVWWLWIKYIHKLSWTAATTSRKNFDWKRVFTAFAIVGIVSLCTTYLGYELSPDDFEWNYQPDKFWILVVIAVVMVPIQTTWEELFFRSYMMQGLGLMSNTRWLPFILTSMIFGMMHVFNPEVAKMGYVIMFWYVGTGFLLGLFTLLDEGTELAIGFHAANNLFIAILVTADWTAFQTDSLLLDVSDPEVGLMTFIPLVIYYPALVLFFAWKYKWNNWNQKLFGKLELSAVDNEFQLK